MGTSFIEVITDYALVEIDDERLIRDMNENPALFFRRMGLYMNIGIAYFNEPPEVRTRLIHTPPTYGDYLWTAVSSASETVVETGLVGFELMSCQVNRRGEDNILTGPYTEAVYEPETGRVTFPPGLAAGTELQLDFYTDGRFDNELTGEEKRILGLCAALVWQERFSGNWLNMQPKIQDRSFSTGSESGHIRANTERLRERRAALDSEIRKYAQNRAYMEVAARWGIWPSGGGF